MNPFWIKFKDLISPVETASIIKSGLQIMKNPGDQVLDSMVHIAGILGGNSDNQMTDEAHEKFQNMFQESSISEQNRIKLMARNTLTKFAWKLEKEFPEDELNKMTSEIKVWFEKQLFKFRFSYLDVKVTSRFLTNIEP